MSEHVGEQFGEYRLTHKLGGGAFGDVYLGDYTRNNTLVAVKILQVQLTNSESLKDYINEIRSLFRLQHPNIVPLIDFGIERNTPFLVMAYAPNGTLRQPKGARLSLDTVVSYIKQIAEALQCAHDRKLIHRDVKPDNILLGPDSQVWLSDFGIVSIAQSSRSLNTQEGAGTIPYMAPEQILGKPRLASDQYALGIIAYEWICGSRPFNGTYLELVAQHTQAPPPPLRNKVPTLAPAIEQVVLKALAKDPKDRFASVREFAEALAEVVKQAKPRPAPQKTKEQWVDEGLAFYNAGKYKEAIETYNHAIKLDPRYARAYGNRGIAYSKLKEYTKGIEDCSRVIELNSRLAVAYCNRGIAHYGLKEYTKAIEDCSCAIELDPGDSVAYRWRGLAYYHLNDYQRAIQDFDHALQLDPGTAWFKSQRENAYRKLGKKP
ncbi:MAG TPA: serine/threonine-protein kinase [Ktedonobacteraceae bacterium]|nr:serine/threonine-protein kinase [Ktedonobacteraceae bacterium]